VPAVARPATEPKPPEPKRRSIVAPLVAGIVALVVVAGGAWYVLVGRPAAVNAPAAHLSIVVLPFVNLSNDPAQDYFADGVTENLTTDLSHIRDSFVIARNTAFTYKGKNVDAKEIGRELNVRYVLEGSVQRDQGRVRVNAQLIDAQTGAHLWADRFEEDVADLFKLQDEVVARLANSLGYALVNAEAETGARSTKPDAVDLDMRARAAGFQSAQQTPTKERFAATRALFERALAIDPNDADALAGLADMYLADFAYAWTDPGVDYDAKILGLADRSIALQRDSVDAYFAKSVYLTMTQRANDALRVADAGLAVNPNSAFLWSTRASAETLSATVRTSAARYRAGQAVESSRSETAAMAQFHGGRGARSGTFGRRDRRIHESHRCRISQLVFLPEPGGRAREKGRSGSGQDRARRSAPTQSQAQHQILDGSQAHPRAVV
jgi:TolB-like protein